jgi:hypothetical protein
MKYRDGAEYAMEKMLLAESEGRYLDAVRWAEGRDRVIAAKAKNREARARRRKPTSGIDKPTD